MHELKHEFTNRTISPWGGIKYLQRVLEKSGIRDFIKSLADCHNHDPIADMKLWI